MRKVKILLLKVMKEQVLIDGHSSRIGFTVSGWRDEIGVQFGKWYSYEYLSRAISELKREDYVERWKTKASGYCQYDITIKGHDFLEQLEDEKE